MVYMKRANYLSLDFVVGVGGVVLEMQILFPQQ